ncbi:MAG: hypothetical protein F6J95_033275 [Leptolyngbya sp. SIO1E4]|nr:hypothetical protein [Leptolyngbya sp. SIO1E4]
MADDVYSAAKIEVCRQAIDQLAHEPRTHFNKREAIAALFEVIAQALENHTYEEVAARLSENGIAITQGSLKQYFLQIKRERQEKPKRKASVKQVSQSTETQTPIDQKPQKKPIAKATKPKKPLPESADEIQLAY